MGAADTLGFGVLGPLEVTRGGRSVTPTAPKQRALLALLLLNANGVVSSDRLIDDLWGVEPPATAQGALQVHVSQLRRLLEPDRRRDDSHRVLLTRPPGYLLKVAPDQLDLHRFERLTADAAAALADRSPEEAAGKLRAALALWRGPALADLLFEPFAEIPAARLEELRLVALEKRFEADLARGRHADVVVELQALAADHPLREGFAAQLMLALYRSGRQAEALEVYQRTRNTLVEELGLEPGPSLQRLERDILTQDPELDLPIERERLPSGLVTLVFTDIEQSTELLERLGASYADLLGAYRRIVRETFGARGGKEVEVQGDGFHFSFPRPTDAARAALECQRALAAQEWPEGEQVRVRIGMHTGSPALVEDGYVGIDVHRAARIGAAAHGGQILLSRTTADLLLAEPEPDTELRELGKHALKGLRERETLVQLVSAGLPPDFPPPRTASVASMVSAPNRAVLVVTDGGEQTGGVLDLAEQLALADQPHELVLARVLDSADGEQLADETLWLGERRAELAEKGVTARLAAFTSADRAADVVRLASRSEVDLLVVPAAPPILRDGAIDETLGALLRRALCDVAFLVGGDSSRRGREGPILVPFGAGEHDWAALELSAWLAGAGDRPLHLLGTTAETESGRRDASRLLADAGLLVQRASGVAPVPRLVATGHEGPVEAAAEGGLLVVGLSERWREEGLGMTRWAIARSAPVPVLFARRGVRPGGLAPAVSATRFGWSVSAPPVGATFER